MFQSNDTGFAAIGAGIKPGEAAFGSTAWAIRAAIRAEKANEYCPKIWPARRELVLTFEITEGKRIDLMWIRAFVS